MPLILIFLVLSCAYAPKSAPYNKQIDTAKQKEIEGKLDSALVLFKKAIELEPHIIDGYLGAGRIWLKKGSLWRARIYLEKAKSLGNNPELELYLAFIAAKQNNFLEALRFYDNADTIAPYWHELTFILGQYFLENNELQSAKEKFQAIITNSPSLWTGHWGAGKIYLAEKNFAQAKQELFTAYKLNPSQQTIISLADLFFELSMFEEAYLLYKIASSSFAEINQQTSLQEKLKFTLEKLSTDTVNNSTSFSFTLENPCNISIKVFNLDGEKIKTIFEGFLTKGKYNIEWDGKNNLDKQLPNGIYLASIETDNFFDAFTIKLEK